MIPINNWAQSIVFIVDIFRTVQTFSNINMIDKIEIKTTILIVAPIVWMGTYHKVRVYKSISCCDAWRLVTV